MRLLNFLKQYSYRPRKKPPSTPPTLYDLVGGERGTRLLCYRFYDIMENDEAARDLLAIHTQDMQTVRQKFFEFMSGWLGGPQLFTEKYGRPKLRARHLHVTIETPMIESWLHCMRRALDETVDVPQTRELIWSNIQPLAWHMRNKY